MTRLAALLVVSALMACDSRDRRDPRGNGGGDGEPADDTACVTCELIDCDDDTVPTGVASEDDCADAALEQVCAEYAFEADC